MKKNAMSSPVASGLPRREFLRGAALAAGAIATPYFSLPTERSVSAQAPSDRLRLAAIGVGSRGAANLSEFNGMTDVVAICDLDSKYGLERVLSNPRVGKKNGDEVVPPDAYDDYRRVLDRDDIDVVSIGAPDHWHTKIAIEAMQSGKHVFCEKPLTLTLEENQLIRAAQKKYGKVFQVGTQQRSMKGQFMTAAAIIRKGLLGKIERTTCIVDQGRLSGEIPKCDPPATLDWERWQGQAPLRDYIWENRTEFFSADNFGQGRGHLLFRWWFDYSGGKITDWGAHHVDSALWALGRQSIGSGPVSFDGSDATFIVPYKDGYPTQDNIYSTPITFNVRCKFSDGTEFDVVSDAKDGNGILFEGTNGRIHVNRERIAGKPIEDGIASELTQEDFDALYNGKPIEGHKQNFLRCVREGGVPVSNAEENVLGMNVCHLANIACRLKREIKWDPTEEKILGDEQAASFFSREQRKGYELPTLS
ncbi:MAG: Gfo/Idh/MocA family oxidoreductase [Thermoguttaceae bacterium]|nr:Gfo/Idh/MocA family oxidoreductase [Thermoguttaceae bacterium]